MEHSLLSNLLRPVQLGHPHTPVASKQASKGGRSTEARYSGPRGGRECSPRQTTSPMPALCALPLLSNLLRVLPVQLGHPHTLLASKQATQDRLFFLSFCTHTLCWHPSRQRKTGSSSFFLFSLRFSLSLGVSLSFFFPSTTHHHHHHFYAIHDGIFMPYTMAFLCHDTFYAMTLFMPLTRWPTCSNPPKPRDVLSSPWSWSWRRSWRS